MLCAIVYIGEEANAERVAGSLRTNPVVVRRLLKQLEGQGLVTIRQGRHGGVALARDPSEITLQEVRAAVDDGGVFALRERGNPNCAVNRAMTGLLAPVFAAADAAVADTLGQTRLAAFIERIGPRVG